MRSNFGPGPNQPEPLVQLYHRGDPSADLQLIYAGFQRCPEGHAWRGRRNHALVHHVLGGAGRVRSGKKEWTLGPGDSFVFFPHADMWYEADRADPWRYLWAGLGGTRLVPCLEFSGLNAALPVVEGRKGRDPATPLAGLLEALEDGTRPAVETSLRIQSLLFALLEALSQPRASGVDRPGGVSREAPYVPEILRFLDQTYSRPITSETIARFAGLERTYCSRLFSKTMGRPLMLYLAELRMEKALELLRTTTMPVGAVAESVGYPDAGVFSKRFRAMKGLSPSEARAGFG